MRNSTNFSIKPLDIKDNPANEVTSFKIFQDRKIFDDDGNFVFHPDGIFSEKIFGRFKVCKCGNYTKPGICPVCGTRVLSTHRIPDFYISFKNCDIPQINLNIKKIKGFTTDDIEKLYKYKGFLYDGKVIAMDSLLSMDLSIYDIKKVKIGRDALLSIGVKEPLYNGNIINKLSVPHTRVRPIYVSEGDYFLGELNTSLINIIKTKTKLDKLKTKANKNVFNELILKRKITEAVYEYYNVLYNVLAKKGKTIISREMRGQVITGAARAVVTNNFSLDEDVALIGYYFIPTLYPKVYEKCVDETGLLDIEKVNEMIKDKYILINRAPTIGEKSIMALKPVFSYKDSDKYVLQLNPIIMDGLAGDFDGDVLLMIALYTDEANQEASQLLPSKNYIGTANGKIRNKIFEDLDYVFKKNCDNNTFETLDDIDK